LERLSFSIVRCSILYSYASCTFHNSWNILQSFTLHFSCFLLALVYRSFSQVNMPCSRNDRTSERLEFHSSTRSTLQHRFPNMRERQTAKFATEVEVKRVNQALGSILSNSIFPPTNRLASGLISLGTFQTRRFL
jgi:hypothetical protein